MKTKIIIGIALLSVAFATYFFMCGESSSAPATNFPVDTENAAAKTDVQLSAPSDQVPRSVQDEADFTALLSPQEKERLPEGYVLTAEEKENLLRKKRQKDFVPTMEELKVMINTPVEFYGQVLDQFDQPVIGANIRCSWPNMGPGDSPKRMQSGAPDGKFDILGFNAPSIHVSVSPPLGYDEQVSESKNIQIAKSPERIQQNEDYKKLSPEQKKQMVHVHGAEEAYKGDKAKPVIFRLKKL